MSRHGGRFDVRKRRSGAASSAAGDESEEGIELEDLRATNQRQSEYIDALHSPMKSKVQGVFNMQEAGQKELMAGAIWTVDFFACMEALRVENPELVAVLMAQMSNTTPLPEISAAHKQQQLDGILLNVVRGRALHNVPQQTGPR